MSERRAFEEAMLEGVRLSRHVVGRISAELAQSSDIPVQTRRKVERDLASTMRTVAALELMVVGEEPQR